jgi:glycolate oxidase
MALTREVYQALEDIVGPDNISDDPATLDSYAFQWVAELSQRGSKFMPRPEAALLPGSTEEVQAIVRTCNRYKIKCKAFSTGWGPYAAPKTEGVIQLDLRRMDRILEIDEKNMFAVVEPYVTGAQLQAEAMKVGLNTHIIGAGSSCSVIAACTSFLGPGPDSIYMGHSSENLLAMEWVMPTGDILRTGSLGSGAGWFCGDGPGPSLRGIARGRRGAWGGLGVFTKCAVKLSPWPGPAVMPVEGMIPAYNSPLPENFRAYTLAFPTWESYADAYNKIYDAEIGYIAHRQFNLLGEEVWPAYIMRFIDPTKTTDDLEELLELPEIQRLKVEGRRSFQLVLAGVTPRDIEYQKKALNEILAETGGRIVSKMAEPAMERFTLLYLIKMCFKEINMGLAGTYIGTFAQHGTPDFLVSHLRPAAEEALGRHQRKGLIADTGADSMMAAVSGIGGGGDCTFEQFCHYDPHNKESVKGALAYCADAARAARERGMHGGLEDIAREISKEELEESRRHAPQPIIYAFQRKIKEAFDPNDIGDGSYIATEEVKY